MRLLPGYAPQISNESISSYHFITHAINDPDILPTLYSIKEMESPLSSLLNLKGLKTRNLTEATFTNKIRVVGSNHIMYAIPASDLRKVHIVENVDGVTFDSNIYPTQPGKNQSAFYIYTDSNWIGPKEVIQLNDNRTQLYVYDPNLPVEVAEGVWRYEVKLKTNSYDNYVNTDLLASQSECMPISTAYEHDFSETANEKYTFPTWGHSYLTLQRVKYSYSGTAEAMKENKKWYIHKGNKGFLTEAEEQMMMRAAKYAEHDNIFGQGTVTEDGKVLLHDKLGREVIAGSGILNQGDGAYDFPYVKWNKKFLQELMKDIDLRIGEDGLTEVALIGGKEVTSGFSSVMREYGITMNQNIVGDGADKGINDTYSYYEFDGVRVIPKRYAYYDSVDVPTKRLSDGTSLASHEGFLVPLGVTNGGDRQIELVQLRKPTMGSINGINKGGEGMATSVDGTSVHFLFQTGVICRTKITRIFRDYNS
jgi:hypothetical protein